MTWISFWNLDHFYDNFFYCNFSAVNYHDKLDINSVLFMWVFPCFKNVGSLILIISIIISVNYHHSILNYFRLKSRFASNSNLDYLSIY